MRNKSVESCGIKFFQCGYYLGAFGCQTGHQQIYSSIFSSRGCSVPVGPGEAVYPLARATGEAFTRRSRSSCQAAGQSSHDGLECAEISFHSTQGHGSSSLWMVRECQYPEWRTSGFAHKVLFHIIPQNSTYAFQLDVKWLNCTVADQHLGHTAVH